MRDEFSGARTVVLVSCVGRKLNYPAPAKDLYQSSWFKKARAFAERVGDVWFILSARYYLVAPDTIIGPYDQMLGNMHREERQAWADVVAEQCRAALRPRDSLVVLAGRDYRVNLLPNVLAFVHDITVPMEGLGIGQQLAWLDRATSVSA